MNGINNKSKTSSSEFEEAVALNGENIDDLVSGCRKMNILLNKSQIEQFDHFYRAMVIKNRVMNLTAITDPGDVVEKHFLDSLSLTLLMNLKDQSILDLGTGAGFPGIPLKIAFPEVKMTLVDSLKKRVCFLQDVIDQLHLTYITSLHGRAEDLGKNKFYRQNYDVVVSRAVANLSVLCEYCLPFVKTGGCFVAYKSGNVEDEITQANYAIDLLGGKCVEIKEFMLQGDYARTLVKIDKVRDTPRMYPRKAGLPAKQPLTG